MTPTGPYIYFKDQGSEGAIFCPLFELKKLSTYLPYRAWLPCCDIPSVPAVFHPSKTTGLLIHMAKLIDGASLGRLPLVLQLGTGVGGDPLVNIQSLQLGLNLVRIKAQQYNV